MFVVLLKGAAVTVGLAVCAIALSIVLGLPVALGRLYGPLPVRTLAAAYVFTIRGVPLLILLVGGYFCLPYLGVDLPVALCAILIIGFYFAAYTAEVFRAAIMSIPRTQWDAGRSVGFRRLDVFRIVIFPQTIRFCAAPLINISAMIVKSTSLVSAIGAWELLTAGREIAERTYVVLPIYIGVAVIYFVMCFVLSRIANNVERNYAHA